MNVAFRAARRSDLEAMVALLGQDSLGQSRENPNQPLVRGYRDAFAAIQSDDNNQLIVACNDDELVGMLQLTFIPYLTHMGSWRCLIEGVRVKQGLRGKGLGKMMFEHAIEIANQKGCKIVQLTSDKQRPDAIQFYRKLGFADSHEGFKLQL